MFFGKKRRSFGTACKSAIALAVLPIWLVSMSYCGIASTVICKSVSSKKTDCQHHSDESNADSHSQNDSHPSKGAPNSKGEVCCESVKIFVTPTSNVVVQPPPATPLLWILSDISLLDLIKQGMSGEFHVYDHGPPGSSTILSTLRHSHQENAPPQSV